MQSKTCFLGLRKGTLGADSLSACGGKGGADSNAGHFAGDLHMCAGV